MSVSGILTADDLEKIAGLLEENGYIDKNITVVINVKNKETLSRINDDFYYRNNQEGVPPDVDEVNVTVSNTRFKYVVEEQL